jgi:hypothetical protein
VFLPKPAPLAAARPAALDGKPAAVKPAAKPAAAVKPAAKAAVVLPPPVKRKSAAARATK